MPCTCEIKVPSTTSFDFNSFDLSPASISVCQEEEEMVAQVCNAHEAQQNGLDSATVLMGEDQNEELQLNFDDAPLALWRNKTSVPRVKTLAVFDWDDTLLATSHLAAAGYRLGHSRPKNPQVDAALQKLDVAAQALLQLALDNCHHVCIITNAEAGWVELSSKSWLPGVAAMLDKVTLISARTTYERFHPNSPLLWKLRAFQDVTQKFHDKHGEDSAMVHILSFGDSNVEREAARAVASSRSSTKAKSVKFAEQPTIEILRLEILAMTSRFLSLVEYESELDLMLPVANASLL